VFADLDATVRDLLIQHVPLDPNEVEIAFDTPDREWSNRLTRPTVNCFLFDVRENLKLRAVGWEVRRGPDNVAARQRAPLRIDASYQVTAWARAPEDEHRLLWRILAALVRHDPLPRDLLRGELLDQPGPVGTAVAQPDQMPANFADLWQGLENKVRPGLTYVVTLVLDPEILYRSPVVLHQPQIGLRQIAPETARADFELRGRVLDREQPGQGLAGAVVVLAENGARATTDAEGRFALPGTRRGPAGITVLAAGRPEVRVSATFPGEGWEIEL